MSEPRFRIANGIVHEAVDDEVIAIDLDSGSYYSLAGSGPALWELLAVGASETELVAALAVRFECEPERLREDVSRILAELSENGLVSRQGAPADAGSPGPDPGPGGRPYEPPRFERYTDMKDYFLLDPIHEVDQSGWPKPAA